MRSLHGNSIQENGNLPTIDTKDLLSRTFITTPDADGVQTRAKIIEIEPADEMASDARQRLFKFKCQVGEEQFEEIRTYNKMLEWVAQDEDKDNFWKIKAITGHRKKKGSKRWEVRVLSESGLQDWWDFADINRDDEVSLAMYGHKHGLLDLPQWKHLKRITKKKKTLARMINQTKLRNFRNKPVYKYGKQVPRNHREAMLIDEKNGNEMWKDSEKLEMSQLLEYKAFKSLGIGADIPDGYKKITCHFVYDVKADGRAKSRCVAGGHRTGTPVDPTYSGVVSIQGVRLVTLIAELNDLELWGTDIGNAYLEAVTTEKVAFIAGAEFGDYEGHTLIIYKAQYGLKASGKCWHDKLHDILRAAKFFPSKADEDIWMRDCGDHYEYIAVYVDDLLIASKNPQGIIDYLLSEDIGFKLKGTGLVKFHLGCDYYRDDEGVLCVGPHKYIDRMVDSYTQMFGEKPRQKYQSPLEKNDHPELDTSPLLSEDGISQYQSLIGILQWTITLGRFDVGTSVMSMSSFRVAPREGHLERLKRICGYLLKFKQGAIRIRTEEPDYSDLHRKEYDWERTAYGGAKEDRPSDAPEPKGKFVTTTTYKDANLYHDFTSGKAVTGVLHFVNQTPIDWWTKKQSTVETATYSSEFSAARTAIQQISGLRLTLRYLGVPIRDTSYLFGDNESVVTSSTVPHSQLKKRHNALAFHYSREAIASKMITFEHLPGQMNPADILSKHWSHNDVYPMLRPLLFYSGNTMELIE